MKKLAALAVFAALFLASGLAQAKEYPWELKKDSNGIKVYTRHVEGSPVLEFKSIMTLDEPQEKVVSFYEKVDRYTEWFHQCAQARVLEEKPNGNRLIYYVSDLPWPASDRDIAYERSKKTVGDDVIVNLTALPDAYPRQKDLVRVPYLKTEWHFKKTADNKTEVSFQQHCSSGGSLPAALINKLSVNIPFHTFQNLRDILKKEKS